MKTFKMLVTWMIVGAFSLNSGVVLTAETESCPHPKNTEQELKEFYRIGTKISTHDKVISEIDIINICDKVNDGFPLVALEIIKSYKISWARLHQQVKCERTQVVPGGRKVSFHMSLLDLIIRYESSRKIAIMMLKGIIKNDPDYLKVVFNEQEEHLYPTAENPLHSFKLYDRMCAYARERMRLYSRTVSEGTDAKELIADMIYIFNKYKKKYNVSDSLMPYFAPCDYTSLNPHKMNIYAKFNDGK